MPRRSIIDANVVLPFMNTFREIQSAIEKLSPQERRELAAWYEERQSLLNSADAIFQSYDDEEEKAG